MPIPEKLRKWANQPGAVLGPVESAFIEAIEEYFKAGVGFGFAQQVIEWMWQEFAERMGFPGSAWGPEYFNARIHELETELAALKAQQN